MAQFLVPERTIAFRRECTLDEVLPSGHLARFVWYVLKSLDFSEMEAQYASIEGGEPGRPPYHPRVLAALWIYGMTQGVETAAEISRSCTLRDDFRWLAGGLTPCDQTLLNFLKVAKKPLPGIWGQVLRAMQKAGHIDLSALAEDGTKIRANTSPRSFRTAEEIGQVIDNLKATLARKLQELVPPEAVKTHRAKLGRLRRRLQKAEQASEQLRERALSPSQRTDPGVPEPSGPNQQALRSQDARLGPRKFTREDFHHDQERDVMICPQGKVLALVGVYPRESGRGDYRMYRRRNCDDCPIKSQCTQGKGRVLKIPVQTSPAPETASPTSQGPSPAVDPAPGGIAPPPAESDEEPKAPPRASITEPDARLMLGGGSEKRIEPSYNADITVTSQGIIVSQFLTTEPNDFWHFRRAMPAVTSLLGRPQAWIGDGHYATHANLVLADQAGVTLYAPMASLQRGESGKFTSADFRHDPERNVMVCPDGKDLVKVGGIYGEKTGRPYELYRRLDCGDCPVKSKCTEGRGRRVNLYTGHALLAALEARMNELGNQMERLRGQTVEPVNGQLKQHGLGRFHVHGLDRCNVVLALSCIAHNLKKWKAREAARALKTAA